MKTYCFDQTEINLVLKCLRYAVEYGYTAELSDDECSEYVDLKELIDRIDPKPVQREGWMNIYERDGLRRYGGIHTTQQEALTVGADPRNRRWGAPVQCVRVTWEE